MNTVSALSSLMPPFWRLFQDSRSGSPPTSLLLYQFQYFLLLKSQMLTPKLVLAGWGMPIGQCTLSELSFAVGTGALRLCALPGFRKPTLND